MALSSITHWLPWAKAHVTTCSIFALAAPLPACGEPEVGTALTKVVDGPAPVIAAACETPEVGLPDGSCIRPGIPLDGCGEGFEHDGEYGCDPILPEDDCAAGTMAIPGETACRSVMSCGQGRWGDLPVDGATQYVDASYAGGGSDGSQDKPWTTIGKAYEAAEAGALIAVAQGRYPERVRVHLKPIVLWGVCPEKVSLEGDDTGRTLDLGPGSDGSHVGGIGITGTSFGIGVTGSRDVTIERVWVHHTELGGILAYNQMGTPTVAIRDSLIEATHGYGVLAYGSDVSLRESVVRGTLPRLEDDKLGIGFDAMVACEEGSCDETSRPQVRIERSFIENNRMFGVGVLGGDLAMSSTVVRGTLPQQSDQTRGQGVFVQIRCGGVGACPQSLRARATITGSLIADNHSSGLTAWGSELTIDTTVVRGTQPERSSQGHGTGVVYQPWCSAAGCDLSAVSSGTVSSSLIEANHTMGIMLFGAATTVENTVVRGTLPQQDGLAFGTGIGAQNHCDTLLECAPSISSKLTVSTSLVDDNHYAGVAISYSYAQLNSSVIRKTRPREIEGAHGDGIVLLGLGEATTTIDNIVIHDSARAGLANFGSAVKLTASTIRCAAFELVGQNFGPDPYQFEDGGGNLCGCPDAANACKSVSADLEAPELLP